MKKTILLSLVRMFIIHSDGWIHQCGNYNVFRAGARYADRGQACWSSFSGGIFSGLPTRAVYQKKLNILVGILWDSVV